MEHDGQIAYLSNIEHNSNSNQSSVRKSNTALMSSVTKLNTILDYMKKIPYTGKRLLEFD